VLGADRAAMGGDQVVDRRPDRGEEPETGQCVEFRPATPESRNRSSIPIVVW
jgi:hypothetical protein